MLTTLALCIGANAAIFSMLHTLVLKSLPFPEPGRIVEISNNYTKLGLSGAPSSVQQYLDYREHADAFSAMGLYRQFGTRIIDPERGDRQMNIARVTNGFFEALGVKPLAGNFFVDEDSQPGKDRKLVLTESFWEEWYGRDPNVVGSVAMLGTAPYVIVGIAPRGVEIIDPTVKVIKPTVWQPGWITETNRHPQGYAILGRLFARLQPGASMDSAITQLETIDQRYYDAASTEYKNRMDASGFTLSMAPMNDARLGKAKPRLLLLQLSALVVLLIGCVNIANLMLVRAASRRAELALRGALGGSPGALVRQWLMEPLLLTVAGGVIGFAGAWAGIKLINRFATPFLPRIQPIELTGPVVLGTAALCLAVFILIALMLLRELISTRLVSLIRIQAPRSTLRPGRLASALLVPVQFALALVLLSAAGLLLRSFVNAVTTNPGFEPRQLVTLRTAIGGERARDSEAVNQLHTRMLEAFVGIPGVESAAMASITPMHEEYPLLPMQVVGTERTLDPAPMLRVVPIVGDYFPTMKIPVRAGRVFDGRDNDPEMRTVIIDERAARMYFPGEDPVGRQVALGQNPAGPEDHWTVIGVVGFVSYAALDEVEGLPFLYFPERKFRMAGNSYFVRSARPPAEVLGLIQTRMREVDSTLFQFHFGDMNEFVSASVDGRRGLALFYGIFAGLSLFLAAFGTYSVLSYEVSQRTREIGIRSAIGATRASIIWNVLAGSSRKAALGIALGALGSLAAGRILSASLFGVPSYDPISFFSATAVLLLITLFAASVPAWRATRIHPMQALRAE